MASDERIVELTDLPRSTASRGFTAKVMARLDERPHRHTARLALAFAVSLIVAVLAVEGHRSSASRRASAEKDLLELRRELAQIENTIAATPGEVVLVGGNEEVDYVIDLRSDADNAPFALIESSYY